MSKRSTGGRFDDDDVGAEVPKDLPAEKRAAIGKVKNTERRKHYTAPGLKVAEL
jgi:hypothetical protein